MEDKKKILIVDDEPDLIELLGLRFSSMSDYVIEVAADGKEALEKIAASRPDLVVLDILMPKLNGWQVCEEIRSLYQDEKQIHIIITTACQQADSEDKAKKYAVDLLLLKPYPEEVLIKAIRKVLTESF